MTNGKPVRSTWINIPTVHVIQRGSQLSVAGDLDRPFPAKIVQSYTDGDGKTFYGWVEVVPAEDGEYHSPELDQPDSAWLRSGEATASDNIRNPAFNLNGSTVAIDSLVTMFRGAYTPDGQQYFFCQPHELIAGVLTEELTYQGSAEMAIWTFDGTADVDTEATVEVWDWLLSSGQTVAEDTKVIAGFAGNRWRVIGAQCS